MELMGLSGNELFFLYESFKAFCHQGPAFMEVKSLPGLRRAICFYTSGLPADLGIAEEEDDSMEGADAAVADKRGLVEPERVRKRRVRRRELRHGIRQPFRTEDSLDKARQQKQYIN